MTNRVNSHINGSNTSNQYKSAYRKFISTENDLLKIHNDILASKDAGKVTALTLLDLFTALMIGLGLLGRHSTCLNHV